MASLTEFHAFFCRYEQFVNQANRTDHNGFVAFMDRVRPTLSRLLEELREEEARLAPRFNVFRALRLERKEAVLHTPLLAHLLDPSAAHGQGALFLTCLFDVLRRKSLPSVPPRESLTLGHWIVQREFYIAGTGILDLLIENPRQKTAIIIENKIDADDHSGQLPAYEEWLERERSDCDWRQLVYLTPDGRPPVAAANGKWLCLSYKRDIVGLLNDALKKTEAPPVRELVRQYLAVLRDLVEDSNDEAV